MMIIEGIPLFYIEYAIGQRFKRSAIGCWETIHPALMGIGISCIIVSFFLSVYYIVVIAWCFYYLFASFTSKLPWRQETCQGYDQYINATNNCHATGNSTMNCIAKDNISDCCVHDPQLYYFYNKVLHVSPSIDHTGDGVQWELFGCLTVAWLVVYVCIMKGVKSTGKAAYLTALFPYMILLILLIFGATLEGAGNGLVALFKPNFHRLSDPEIWLDAAVQMFFTLSLGFGALISFASYMPIKNNCVRDAYTVVLINCGTSLFAGMVVFSILGHRQHIIGGDINEIGSGPGLVFITFADAFLQMDASPLWSIMFFIMLILLGIGSEFGTIEGMIAPFYDMKLIKIRKEFFAGLVCTVMLLVGMAFVSSPGFYLFQLFDDYSLSMGLVFIAFFQTIAVAWVYGIDRFSNDIEYMTGKRPYLFWMICWKYISPLAMIIIFGANCNKLVTKGVLYKVFVGCKQQLINFSPLGNGTDESMKSVPYPGWAQFLITFFIILTIMPILIVMLYNFIQNPYAWKEGFKSRLLNPHDYYPDPSILDVSRRKTPEQIEDEIIHYNKNEF